MASDRSSAVSWFNASGGLCLAAMLALWSPGVQVARAEEAPARSFASRPLTPGSLGGVASDANSCEVGAEKGPELAAQLAQLMEDLESQAAADGEEVVVFNGAGRNYRSGDDVLAEIRRIRAEVRRRQAVPQP